MKAKGPTLSKEAPEEFKCLKIPIDTSASITDYQYNYNGAQLAVSDTNGNILIYTRHADSFTRAAKFSADDAAVLKISWADPCFGELLAIGTFKRKVAVFQHKNQWVEVASHELHEGSVNHVEWASTPFGLKLYAGGSDGTISILELKKNSWVYSNFVAHENAVHSFSLQPVTLVEEETNKNYPMLATAGKDMVIKVWRHLQDIPEKEIRKDSRIYQQVAFYRPHKEAIRSVLWKKIWDEAEPKEYALLSASEDGTVNEAKFVGDELTETLIVCQHEAPIYRLSQSMTGNLLSVSVGNAQEQSYLYEEQEGVWIQTEVLK